MGATEQRWMVAAASAVVLWVLFLTAALVWARERLRHQPGMSPQDRWRIYGQWRSGIRLTALAGLHGTLLLLDWNRWFSAFNASGVMVFVFFYYAPLSLFGLIGVLAGLPLQRDANAQISSQHWVIVAINTLAGRLIALLVLGSLAWGFAAVARLPIPVRETRVFLTVALALAVSLPLLSFMVWMLKSTGSTLIAALGGSDASQPPEEPPWEVRRDEAPADLAALVRSFASSVGCPSRRVRLRDGGFSVATSPDEVLVSRGLVEALQPDQVAGLAAAALLAEQRTPAEQRLCYGAACAGCLMVVSLVLVVAILLASAPFAGYVALLMFIGVFPAGIAAWLVHRQSQHR
ncbi:MAG TPA: hypothetical protein VK689_13240, partial [Armatimonadota bacterium]|nr:hypothetical protein [Armatimonadota bacterium]